MASPGISPTDAETLGFGLLIGFILLRRAVAQIRGTLLSPSRLFGFLALYLVLFVLVIASGVFLLPLWSVGADAAAIAAGAVVAYGYVLPRVAIYQQGGAWMYRLGIVVPVAYVALFLVRLGLEAAIGIDPFAGPTTTALTSTEVETLVIVDALFAFGTGMAAGRTAAIYAAFRKAESAAASAPRPAEPT